jgi:hypothetical protein
MVYCVAPLLEGSGGEELTDRAPVEVTNLDRYGSPALPWGRPHDLLAASPTRSDITTG